MGLATGGFTNATFYPLEEGSPGYVIPCRILEVVRADDTPEDDTPIVTSDSVHTYSMSFDYINWDLIYLLWGVGRVADSKMRREYRRKTRRRNRRR